MNKLSKNILQNRLEQLFVFFSYIVAPSMFWGIYFSKFLIVIWGFIWLTLSLVSKFESVKDISKTNKIIFLSIVIYYLLHLIGILYSENSHSAFRNIEIKLYLIIIPIILITSINILEKHYKSILILFVIGGFFASITLIGIALYHSISLQAGKIVFQAQIDSNYSFFESINNSGNYFFYSFLSRFHHPSYASILVMMSIIILLFIDKLPKKDISKIDKIFSKKTVTIPLIIFFAIIILLLSSKANFIALTIVIFLNFIFSKTKIIIKIFFILAWIIIGIVMIAENPRFNMYVKYLTDGTFKNKSVVKTGTYRYYIWEKGFEKIKENFWFGVGTGDVKDIMTVENSDGFLNKKHNLHNEFLEIFVKLGVFGALSLLSIFILSFWRAFKGKNHIFIYFLIIVIINFFFESMLERVAGTMFFGFFNFFLFFYSNNNMIKK